MGILSRNSCLAFLLLLILPHLSCALPPKERSELFPPVNKDKLAEALQPNDVPKQELGGRKKVGAQIKEDSLQIQRPQKVVKKRPDLVQRPDHLEAVPLERDGHLNKKFRQEVFLGEDHHMPAEDIEKGEKFARKTEEDPVKRLEEVFQKADANKDKKLSREELENWIRETVQKHLDDGVEEARKIFKIIDENEDELLTWDEYHYHFLVDKRLMEPDKARNHKEEDHAHLNPDDQDQIAQELEEWREADGDGQEGLSQAEFLAFRHPEHSRKMLDGMAKDILQSLDRNNDNQLSEDEFGSSAPGELEEQENWAEEEKAYLEERRKEFRDQIDKDKNGFATLEELVEFINPRNPMHARQEAKELMELADGDRDDSLDWDEILEHKTMFLGSSMVNPGKTLHDEF